MEKFFKIFSVLVALSTFISAWGFKKGDIFSFNEEISIVITEVESSGRVARSKFFHKKVGLVVLIFEKKENNTYFVRINLLNKQELSDESYYIKEIEEGLFINSYMHNGKMVINKDQLKSGFPISLIKI